MSNPTIPALARDLAAAVRSGELTAVDVTKATIARLEATQAATNAFRHIHSEFALEQARALDERIAEGRTAGRLAGVPVALKDNILVEGLIASCGSKLLENYVGSFDAHVVEKLRAEDAIIVAHANMDEFAMGGSNENCAYGNVKNPVDLGRVPGGSSGGSAAAVAAGSVPVSLGSDTGGSVRQPAAFTGTVGVKPTYGRISRRGVVAFASSLDQISPFATDVRDAALITEVLSGLDNLDATSLTASVPDWVAACDRGIKGMKLGIPKQCFPPELDPGVKAAIQTALDTLVALGAELVELDIPALEYGVATYYIIAPAEASANLARFDGIRYGERKRGVNSRNVMDATRSAGFGPEVKRRVLTGTYVLSSGYVDAYYNKAQQVREEMRLEMTKALESVDAIVGPTAPTVAFEFGARKNPLDMYMGDMFTIPASMSGLPAVSVPAGTSNGLPVGLHIVGDHLDEATCFAVAAALESANLPTASREFQA